MTQKLQKYKTDTEAPASLNSVRADACMRLVDDMCGTILADFHAVWNRADRDSNLDEQLVTLQLLEQREELREKFESVYGTSWRPPHRNPRLSESTL